MTSCKRVMTVIPSLRYAGRRALVRLVSPVLLPITALPLLVIGQLGQAAPPPNTTAAHTVGEASDLYSAEPLYSETHCLSDDTLVREIFYRNGQQQLLAHKILSYRSGPTTPSYMQYNFYAGELITVTLQQNAIAMRVEVEGDAVSLRTLSATNDDNVPLVIDAGFDIFVTDNWDTLVDGHSLRFQFPFAAHESLVDLRITSAQCSYETTQDQCFRLELDSWLLSKLVASIELGYDATLRRLNRYRGLSNIANSRGDSQVVDIRYSYENLPAKACTVNDLV